MVGLCAGGVRFTSPVVSLNGSVGADWLDPGVGAMTVLAVVVVEASASPHDEPHDGRQEEQTLHAPDRRHRDPRMVMRRKRTDVRSSCARGMTPRELSSERRRSAYAYVLGRYLGDGCVSSHPLQVYRMRIICSIDWPLVMERLEVEGSHLLPMNKVGRYERDGERRRGVRATSCRTVRRTSTPCWRSRSSPSESPRPGQAGSSRSPRSVTSPCSMTSGRTSSGRIPGRRPCSCCARGGTRTRMAVRPADFESAAYANSATRAGWKR